VNSASYCEVLLRLHDAIRRKRPGHLARGVLFHPDNARPHTARATQERIQELQWKLLEHPPYSSDLAPSDFNLFGPLKIHLGDKRFADDKEARKWLRQQWKHFHLFGPLKDHLGYKHFGDGEEVEKEAREWLGQQSIYFYAAGFDAVLKRRDKCINVNAGHVEK
jgi:transposase